MRTPQTLATCPKLRTLSFEPWFYLHDSYTNHQVAVWNQWLSNILTAPALGELELNLGLVVRDVPDNRSLLLEFLAALDWGKLDEHATRLTSINIELRNQKYGTQELCTPDHETTFEVIKAKVSSRTQQIIRFSTPEKWA